MTVIQPQISKANFETNQNQNGTTTSDKYVCVNVSVSLDDELRNDK